MQQSVISATIEFIDHLPLIPNFDITGYILSNYSGEIKEHISKMFPWIMGNVLDNLTAKVCTIFNKDFFRSGYVGIAFADMASMIFSPKCSTSIYLELFQIALDMLFVNK